MISREPSYDLRQLISDCPWFEDLSVEACAPMVESAVVRTMPVDSYVYEQGLPSTEIFCLLSGRVRVSMSSPNGQEFALVDHEPGTWLGLPALVGDEGRVIDARVIEASDTLYIPRAVVLEVAEQHPLVYRRLFLHAQETLRGFHELMAGILFYPLRVRVAGRLLHLMKEHGRPVAEGVQLDIRVSQNEFARLALGSRQRVNRIFRDWNERGLVVNLDDHLLVPDPAELEKELEVLE